METFKDRLIKEKADLDDKVAKLSDFLASEKVKDIPSQQVTLLNVQLPAMETYSQILLERITLLD